MDPFLVGNVSSGGLDPFEGWDSRQKLDQLHWKAWWNRTTWLYQILSLSSHLKKYWIYKCTYIIYSIYYIHHLHVINIKQRGPKSIFIRFFQKRQRFTESLRLAPSHGIPRKVGAQRRAANLCGNSLVDDRDAFLVQNTRKMLRSSWEFAASSQNWEKNISGCQGFWCFDVCGFNDEMNRVTKKMFEAVVLFSFDVDVRRWHKMENLKMENILVIFQGMLFKRFGFWEIYQVRVFLFQGSAGRPGLDPCFRGFQWVVTTDLNVTCNKLSQCWRFLLENDGEY